jgi:hypothetical protein
VVIGLGRKIKFVDLHLRRGGSESGTIAAPVSTARSFASGDSNHSRMSASANQSAQSPSTFQTAVLNSNPINCNDAEDSSQNQTFTMTKE